MSGGDTRGRNIVSEVRMLQGVEGIGGALEGFVIHYSSKEVHGPGCIVLGLVLKVGGLVGEGQEVPVVQDDGKQKEHVIGGMGIVDCVDVVVGCGWEVDAVEEEAVEAGMQKHLVLRHESKAHRNSSDVILVGWWERDVGEVAVRSTNLHCQGLKRRAWNPDGVEGALGVAEENDEEAANMRRCWLVGWRCRQPWRSGRSV